MLVPLSWLREYVDVTLEAEALAERLTLLGMEVKGIERRGADWQGVVVGELLEVKPHPNADRLSLTRVRTSDGGPELAIVCGATNIAAGQRVPVALPGAVLPGDRRIERAPKMGVVSEGMLCSGDELRLTTDADGILILPPDAPLGTALVDLLGDVILDIDVKPNRGDALSMVGLAREVAAATGATLRRPVIEVPEAGDATSDHLSVSVQDPAFCSRFVGRYVDGVTVGPSPLWVQMRLSAAGQRPVSNVVDASNYVMLELGKPIHTFDAAAVQGGHIEVRSARPGERLETLDHVMRELTPTTGLIADSRGALGIAGVMGGAASEVGAGTKAVVIESAIFDPVAVRRTAHHYALRSEASLRFEKGQPHGLAREGADRTAQLIAAWAGGRVARGVIDSDPHEPPLRRVPFRPGRVSRLLGVALPASEQAGLLGRVEVATEAATAGDRVPVAAGLEVTLGDADAAAALVATIPAHRRDLVVEADLAEEVARVRGYETIAGQLPATAMPPYRPDPRRGVDRVRDLLDGRGLTEVVTHALIGPDDHVRLGWPRDDAATIRVANPISPDHSELRRSLLPGLVGVLTENERQRRPDVAVFEIGSTHVFAVGGPQEEAWLGFLLAGAWPPASWDRAGAVADIGDGKGLVTWLADRLGLRAVRFGPLEPWAGIEHPGRVAAVLLDHEAGSPGEIGRVGELHPQYLEACGSRAERVAFGLLRIGLLQEAAERTTRVVPWPRVPAVERDLALIVRAEQPAGEVEALIRAEAGDRLRALTLFDRYAGPPLVEGEISLAYRLRLQAPDQTLTDADVDRLLDRVVAALRDRLGVRRRA
ncbi:MAG TPA: phenylalanine--tRNA ligase subunit beta [Candidatus Limnocylindrales bacterium]|jgi:phenylalanyl-tRNA synthetase beta chain